MSDPRSLAEALYDESLGDDAGSMLCELLDLHANRADQNTACHARRIFSGAVRAGLGADAQGWRSRAGSANAVAGGIDHVGAATTSSQARSGLTDARGRRGHDTGMLY